MTFRVGQKVVCIGGFDESDRRLGRECGFTVPVEHSIYTITGFAFEEGFIMLAEIPPIEAGKFVAFDRSRFRPIVERKTDISIFTKMLTPEGVDA